MEGKSVITNSIHTYTTSQYYGYNYNFAGVTSSNEKQTSELKCLIRLKSLNSLSVNSTVIVSILSECSSILVIVVVLC